MPETKRPLKVFLCHASTDKPKVRELYRFLKRRGIQPWFDEINLIGGQDWQVEIPKALATSDAIIICLTKSSIDKEGYIQKEIKFALDKALEMPEGRIFLIPVKFEECDIPYSLSRYQWVDLFSNESGYSKMMKALKFRAAQLDRSPTVELSRKAMQEEMLALKSVAREKSEREASEKFIREQAEFDAAEQAARNKANRVSAEKVGLEKEKRRASQRNDRKLEPIAVLIFGMVGVFAVLICLLGLFWAGSILPQYFSPKITYTATPTITIAPSPDFGNLVPTSTPIPLTSEMIAGKVQVACGGDVSFVNSTSAGVKINLYKEERVNGVSSAGDLYLELPLVYARELNLGSNTVKSSYISDRTILDANVLLSKNAEDSHCIYYWETSEGFFGAETTYALASNQNVSASFLYWVELPLDNRAAERAQFYFATEPTAKPTRGGNSPQQPTKPSAPSPTPTAF